MLHHFQSPCKQSNKMVLNMLARQHNQPIAPWRIQFKLQIHKIPLFVKSRFNFFSLYSQTQTIYIMAVGFLALLFPLLSIVLFFGIPFAKPIAGFPSKFTQPEKLSPSTPNGLYKEKFFTQILDELRVYIFYIVFSCIITHN